MLLKITLFGVMQCVTWFEVQKTHYFCTYCTLLLLLYATPFWNALIFTKLIILRSKACSDWPAIQCVVIGRIPQAWDRNVIIPLTYCDACPGKTRPITNKTFVASTWDIITDYNDLGYVHTWRLFWQEKVDERFFNEKQSWQRLLQIAAESVFCCHSNSCNSSIALCAAEMSRKSTKLALALAFEVNGK